MTSSAAVTITAQPTPIPAFAPLVRPLSAGLDDEEPMGLLGTAGEV